MIKTTDVFKTQGKPTHTYVSVTDGEYERRLKSSIESKGTLCLVTGPSKTGKTTLVSRVAQDLDLEIIDIRCDKDLSSTDFWRSALEKVRFEHETGATEGSKFETSFGGKIGGKLGWAWLAGISGEVSTNLKGENSEEIARERILSKPSPNHLIPVLKNLPYILIVEDFHYLSDEVRATIFQQWKVFVDDEVSVVILGTTHHACDLAYANKDLVGRVSKIDLTTWGTSELKQIVEKGATVLNVIVDGNTIERIASESVGLPIVTQSICLELFFQQKIDEFQPDGYEIKCPKSALNKVFHEVSISRYSQFEYIYERLIRGLRKGRRKYKTYEWLLAAFSADPIRFKLTKEEIRSRFSKLPIPNTPVPPESSINSSLSRISKLQEKIDFELLEWVPRDETLYILEPSFLFYLRWRKSSYRESNLDELYHILFDVNTSKEKGVTIRFIEKKTAPRSE